MPPSGTTAGTASDVYHPAALRLRGPALFNLWGPVGRIRNLCRHPPQPRVRCLMCIARRRCACAGLRCLNLWRTRRPDKAFMPPSGTTAGTASDVYRPAALFEPAGARRPDKAFMPPSGTTAGTASIVYRPAALRLHGPGGRRNACWRSLKTITAKAVPS